MPKTAERVDTTNGQVPLELQEMADSAVEQIEAEKVAGDEKVHAALTLHRFAKYLLSRSGKQRLGIRRSFTDNLFARYLANELGGEWLVTDGSAMNAETMRSFALPLWATHTYKLLSSQESDVGYVNVDAAIRATLEGVAAQITELDAAGDLPF